MKIAEMQTICDKQQHNMGCCKCPLFTPLLENGCLKNHRYEISKKYQNAITSNNEVLAEKIMKDYQDLERKVLKT